MTIRFSPSRLFGASILGLSLVALPLAAQDGDNWEGLTKVRSERVDAAYLLPNVDFRAYTKVQLTPTEVAFRQGWQRDYNRTAGPGARISDAEAAEATANVRTGFDEIFASAFREGGYQVVTEPGPDVLRLRTAVLDLYVAAPEQMTAGRTRTYSVDAGEALLVIEARDSLTGALLGRALDRRLTGDNPGRRTSVSNRADFEHLFHTWARASVRGLDELKARSPIN